MAYPQINLKGDFPPMTVAFTMAQSGETKMPADILGTAGMSGRKYRMFINNLVGMMPGAKYLEIGLHHGSTFLAAIYGNSVTATGIDNWSQFGAEHSTFMTQLNRAPGARTNIITADFRTVDYAALPQHDIYFFDGPHDEGDHYDAVRLVQPALGEKHVLIVDDWNAAHVRAGTLRGIEDCGLVVAAMIEVLTAEEGKNPDRQFQDSDWHQGVMIAALRKPVS